MVHWPGDMVRSLPRQSRRPERSFANGLADRSYFSCPVPGKFVADAARQPRLRRSGTISLLGAAAGFDAFADAGLKPDSGLSDRIAVVFAICSGGVNYTRRFYHEIVTQGAHGASPLLFPETVYNAAASHLAALLGVNDQSYTLVGDSSVGLGRFISPPNCSTMQPELDRCLVVGTEEADWLLADAFASWRMATNRGSVRSVWPVGWNDFWGRRCRGPDWADRDAGDRRFLGQACRSIHFGRANRRPERCLAACAAEDCRK